MRISAPLNHQPLPALQWIEVASSLHIPFFQIIGLPGPEVAEAKERVRAAIEATGLKFPRRRVVLNLSPASIRKRGTGLDLAIALAVVNLTEPESSSICVAWGELGLDGSVKSCGQVTRALYAAWDSRAQFLILSLEDARSAQVMMGDLRESGKFPGDPPILVSVQNLSDAIQFLKNPGQKKSHEADQPMLLPEPPPEKTLPSLLKLPDSLERRVAVAAAGNHHLLLLGPKGTGKTHALDWLCALYPKASTQTQLEQKLLAEFSNSEQSGSIRRVGSQVRPGALVGRVRGDLILPGEFSLAHGGLLIADEFPEWSRDSREVLREPLESGRITLTRAESQSQLPAAFMFAGNGNFCPCGGWPSDFPISIETSSMKRLPTCRCARIQRERYLGRISGPILDRIDLIAVTYSLKVQNSQDTKRKTLRQEHLLLMKQKVDRARKKSIQLYGHPPGMLPASSLEDLLRENPSWNEAVERFSSWSLRAKHKIVRVALSLAIWDGKETPTDAYFLEASCYRPEHFGFCE